MIVAALCTLPSVARAGVSLDTIVSRLSAQATIYPQEKVYLHIDHWQCARGERINYRAYCVNAITHEPMDTSRFVYVELIDNSGKVLTRNKNVNDYGCATGYLTIPKKTEAGVCFIRAYTRRSAEHGAQFVSVTPIMVSAAFSDPGGTRAGDDLDAPVLIGEQQGMTLTLMDSTLRVSVGEQVAGRGLCLVLLNRMIPFYFEKVKPGATVDISVATLPTGVGRAIVVNEDYDIVASACFVAAGHSQDDACPVAVRTAPRDHCQLVDVSLPGLLAGEEAQVSIGVKRASPFEAHRDIGYELGVNADVPGGTGWLSHAFAPGLSPLLTIGGGRYELQRALHGDYLMPSTDVEVTTTISGTTKSLLFNRPVKTATVTGLSPAAGVYASTVSNDKGEFVMGGLDFMGGDNEFVIQAMGENGSKDVYLKVKEPDFPATGTTRIEREPYSLPDAQSGSAQAVSLTEVTDEDSEPFDAGSSILLPNLEVRGFRMGHQGGKSSDLSVFSDFTISRNYIEERHITNLENVIRMIPGAFYRIPQDGSGVLRLYLRSQTSIYGESPAAFAVDGILVTDFDPSSILVEDIERIDVFKTGSTAMWGHNGAGGVVSIKLKEGARYKNSATPNVQTVMLPGIQPPAEVKTDNNGKTLYWNPDVIIVGEAGHESFYRFEVTIPPGAQYEIVVEGITSTGRTIHLRQPLQ